MVIQIGPRKDLQLFTDTSWPAKMLFPKKFSRKLPEHEQFLSLIWTKIEKNQKLPYLPK